MNKKIEIPQWLCCRIETMCECDSRENHGLKSHDYHIIIERLLSVMLHGYLDNEIWEALAELRYFYRQLCAKEIKKI
jgi:hypothetical protein